MYLGLITQKVKSPWSWVCFLKLMIDGLVMMIEWLMMYDDWWTDDCYVDSKNYALCMISKCYIKFVMIEDQALTINIYPILVCLFLINLPLHCCTCGLCLWWSRIWRTWGADGQEVIPCISRFRGYAYVNVKSRCPFLFPF